MKMQRDITGTCRETCSEIVTEGDKKVVKPIENCYILLGITYHDWHDEGHKTLFNSYWHSQFWEPNNIFMNHKISLTNYNPAVKCMPGQTKHIFVVPYCTASKTRECERDFGY